MADELLEHAQGHALLADAGYDAGRFVMAVLERGMEPVIASNPTRTHELYDLNRKLYADRYQVECFFHRLKRFRAVATRYEKTAQNYLALVQLACTVLWLNALT
jgi:transposase